MGYVFDANDARAYEQWGNAPGNRNLAEWKRELLLELLRPIPGKRVLDIGCGKGASIVPLLEAGLRPSGLDPSPYMLDMAARNLGKGVDLKQGFAEDLPFDDNAFDYACLITTLEFVEDPVRAIEEACRVAKNKVFIGVFNCYAIRCVHLRLKGIFVRTLFNRARFFSVWEIKRMVHALMGDVPIAWQTAGLLPSRSGKFMQKLERLALVRRSPFGVFAGIAVTLVPRFTTNPLPLPYGAKRRTGEVTSSLCANRESEHESLSV